MSLLMDDLLGPPRLRESVGPTAEAQFAWSMLKLTEEGFYVHLEESAKTAGYSVTHAPRGKGGTNWITKSKPGNSGQLPAYIQNVRNGIARGTKDLSKATQIAIGKVKDWASGKGGVHPEVKAAAAKAVAQWEAMKGKNKAKGKVKEAEDSDTTPETDADFDFAALLAQIRAQPKVVPYAPRVFSYPGLPGHAMSYPEGEGADNVVEEVDLSEAFGTTLAAPKQPKLATTPSSGASSGGQSTSRQRWAKWETAHQGQQGGVVQGVQARVGVKTDGQFGAKTKAAVIKFQQKNGLQVDGVVGRQTFAALAGHKNASSVKTGNLTATQASQLANFGRHGGTLMSRSSTSRRAKRLASSGAAAFGKTHASLDDPEEAALLAEMLVEAERATHDEFPGRVKGLKQGEVARMPDGHAVRRISTQDGRDVFQVGSPSAYGDTPGAVNYFSDHHRKAEDAIHSARRRSASSRDPESLGGETSYYKHDSVRAHGRDAVFQGVDMSGNAVVLHKGSSSPTSVPFSALGGGSSVRLGEELELSEKGTEGLFARKKAMLKTDPKGKHKVDHVVKFTTGGRMDPVQAHGVILGFHPHTHEPWIKDLKSGIERMHPRSDITASLGHKSNWTKWNAEHPERSHESVAEVAEPFTPFS